MNFVLSSGRAAVYQGVLEVFLPLENGGRQTRQILLQRHFQADRL